MKLKRMVMVLLTVVALMGMSFAAPAIAEEEVKDEHKAQDEESRKDEEPLKDQGLRDSQDDEQGDNSGADPETKDPSSSVEEEEEPLKNQGIRLCDITPTDCRDTDDDSANHDPSSSPLEEEEE